MQTTITSPMRDALPVRGANAVEILENDHEVIKGLLGELTSATGAAAAKPTLEKLKAVLTIHNATEENLVYPALSVIARKHAESQKLYHETAEADTVVFELDQLAKERDDAAFAKKATALQAAVLEHIDNEEQRAFPHLIDGADAAQTKQLTADVKAFRSSISLT
jgi:hemerythrin superfamily protein